MSALLAWLGGPARRESYCPVCHNELDADGRCHHCNPR